MCRVKINLTWRNSTLTESTTVRWTLAVCMSVFFRTCQATYQVCHHNDMAGFNDKGYCYVFMTFDQEQDVKPMTWLEASQKCQRYKGTPWFDHDVIDRYNNFEESRGMRGIPYTQWKGRTQKQQCKHKLATEDFCSLLCRFPVCKLGLFGPKCSRVCHCQFNYLCDTANGHCHSECLRGYFGPPKCDLQCHCKYIAECDRVTGECPSGCERHWSGKSCQKNLCVGSDTQDPTCRETCNCLLSADCRLASKLCPNGCAKGWRGIKCTIPVCNSTTGICQERSQPSPCLCSDPNCSEPPGKCLESCKPGWSGPNCMRSACPFGYFGPPSCLTRCHCRNPRFCSPLDGNCQSTECEGVMTGPSCLSLGCLPGHYGPPDCFNRCFCNKDIRCDPLSGLCKHGCKTGWMGPNCNQRQCPEGHYGFPRCQSKCRCKSKKACNSVTGECEFDGCEGLWTGRNCSSRVKISPEYRSHSWQAAAGIFIFLGSGMLMVAMVQYQRCRSALKRIDGESIEENIGEGEDEKSKLGSVHDFPNSSFSLRLQEGASPKASE